MRNMLRAILAVVVMGMVLVFANPRQADAHLRRYWAGYGGWYGPPAAYRVWYPRRFVYRAYYSPYIAYPAPVYSYPAPYYYDGYGY